MRYVSNHVRLAIITDINHSSGIAYTKWLDQTDEDGPNITIPHPYAGPGGEGIFVGLRPGSIIALDMTSYERYIPVCIIPNKENYGDTSSSFEVDFDNVGYPSIENGEIVIQGVSGSFLKFEKTGAILLQNNFGEGNYIGDDQDLLYRCSIYKGSPVDYSISQSKIKASGVIRRDIRIGEEEDDFADFLYNPDAEIILEQVGWDPSKEVTYITRAPTASGAKDKDEKLLRNPSLIEDREIIFEYGKDWNIGNYDEELERLEGSIIALSDPRERRERRSNVLSLSLSSPNELIEKINGTVVDIFGNILDINKNIIKNPEGNNEKEILDSVFENIRHSIAFHMKINTRKGWGYRNGDANTRKPIPFTGAPDVTTTSNNARDRSRWEINIDKEGLTTLNIPSTSETGNIPVLARYETSSEIEIDDSGKPTGKIRENDDNKELFRNANNQDIFADQFGPGGIKIVGSSLENRLEGKKTSWKEDEQLLFPKKIETGTAFHEITSTAKALLLENINKRASDIFDTSLPEEDLPAISSEINPNVPKSEVSIANRNEKTGLVEDQPNAGGRSAVVNFDGSLETSIGANTIDRISWTLDTAGALVARIGRDRQGRSAIIQTDGDIALEVGGWDFIGENNNDEVDTRFVGRGDERSKSLPGDPYRFKNGKIVIRLRRSDPENTGPDVDNDDHLLILDETGITIHSVGRMNLISDMDMTISSGSRVLIDAPKIQLYKEPAKFVTKSSRRIS